MLVDMGIEGRIFRDRELGKNKLLVDIKNMPPVQRVSPEN